MLKPTPAGRNKIWLAPILLTVIFAVGLLFFRRRKRKKVSSAARVQERKFEAQQQLDGLSEAQAAERLVKVDLDALREQENKDFKRRAIRQNLLTTFNIDLFLIAIIMLLLDSPWSTFGTLVVLALSVSINVFQEVFTKKMLDQLLNDIRPQSTVIRERVFRSINPAHVVQGDLVVVRQGDQILLNGELVGASEIIVEEQKSNEPVTRMKKSAGDTVYSGSFCVEGRAVYEASEAGSEKYVKPPGRKLQLLYSEMTPLERMMETILRLLFGLAIIFAIFLVVEAVATDVNLISSQFRNAISLIFGIAPTSLFFILILQYATGTRRLSRYGALAYSSTTIEKLSNVSVMCLSKSSLVAGMQVILEMVPPPPDHEAFTENLIRQILGDIAHSISVSSQTASLIAEALPGTPRKILEIVPYSVNRGWSAVTIDEPDLRGTFVIGDPEVLEANVGLGKPEFVQEIKQTVTQTQRGFRRWLKRFNRQDDNGNSQEGDDPESSDAAIESDEQPGANNLGAPQAPGGKAAPAWARRLLVSLDKLLKPMEEREAHQENTNEVSAQRKALFSYLPEPVAIRDRFGNPMLPRALIPLANLRISDVIRPEAQQTIHKLIKAGVKIKIMSADPPQQLLRTTEKLGLEGDKSAAISGLKLEGMEADELSQQVKEKSVFGALSPSQQTQIIQVLKKQGEYVAMVGNDPVDVPAMRQADLRLATKGGSQVALMQTDIVLLKNSIEALPSVLTTGQRLVKSVLDTFKLYLSQVLSQILMIVIVLVLNRGVFPYTAAQGGILTVFAITIPNIVLSAWSASGRLSGPEMRRLLIRFIAPVGFTMPLLAFGVFSIFINRIPSLEFSNLVTNIFEVDDAGLFYAQLAVTYALLFAGWLRLFFLQPPSRLWVGGAPLRGDRRVYGMVAFTIIVFVLFFAIPIFQDLLTMTWLPYLQDYLLVTLCTLVWAVIVSAIWRFRLIDPIANQFAHQSWFRGKKATHQEDFSSHSAIQSN